MCALTLVTLKYQNIKTDLMKNRMKKDELSYGCFSPSGEHLHGCKRAQETLFGPNAGGHH